MTQADRDGDRSREPTAAEIETWERKTVFDGEDKAAPEEFPRMWNMSAGFSKRAIIRPFNADPPEYLTIPLARHRRRDDESLRRSLAVHEWNQLWEAAQFRHRFFDDEQREWRWC